MIHSPQHFGQFSNCQIPHGWGGEQGGHQFKPWPAQGPGSGPQFDNAYHGSGKEYSWPEGNGYGAAGSSGPNPVQPGPEKGNLWSDTDGDGDADMYFYTDGNVNSEALQKAAKNIEDGSNGKLDVHILEGQPDGSVPNAGYIHVKDLGSNMAGTSVIGQGADVTIDDKAIDNERVITHELMHAAGVEADGQVNGGDSIMDYSYNGEGLTAYDTYLLMELYGNL